MIKEFLDSDRLNYLVWRYLLESNYRETAAKFQKEWHIQEPHRHFDFARHIKSHALVSVINKGLCYHALEREYAQKSLPPDATVSATEALQVGIFGPIVAQPPHKVEDDEEGSIAEVENPRKRQLDSRLHRDQHQVNGSQAKRPRLSNGYENGVDAATTPMEIDHHHHHHHHAPDENNQAYPSPQDGEQAPSPVPHTDGPEQGTQVDKVEELATETTFLRLMPVDARTSSPSSPAAAAAAAATTTTTAVSAAHHENAPPILLRCEWNPKDPSSLAASGTDALARIWTVPRAATSAKDTDEISDHVNGVDRPFHSLVDHGITPRTATMGQMAWNSAGTIIAMASDHDGLASIGMWSKDGDALGRFDVPEAPVIKLCWNPSDTALLSITPHNGSALVTVYRTPGADTRSYVLAGHDLLQWPLDAAWTSDSDILLCGGDVLVSLRCTESSVVVEKKFETRQDDSFLQVQFDARTKLAATASAKGVIDLWDETGQRQSISAHSGTITALQWQPLPAGAQAADDERLLASGGDDCAILIWNARKADKKARCFLTMDSPIVGLAFTPDGAFLAGATAGRILIWKVGEHSVPRASWTRTPHPGWLSPRTNSEPEEEDEHCLGWDCDGQRLAYGANSRLAVINFRR
ncbi:hypothetical protein ACRALDRAFT_1091549 [Sodiomyces alcalophilus JCM 7366]|uniref:uncharacterized protein n=1 Tax=Sodiomyces alcalophilus JCM 7366 TaxID=591952 RepID=UPI0039B51981